jgi:hypothetical protein
MWRMKKDVHAWYMILMEDGWRTQVSYVTFVVLSVEGRVEYVT